MARFEELPLPDRWPVDSSVVRRAAEVLGGGGILAHPTETVYGLGGGARPEVDATIARLKGRPAGSESPLLRVVDSVTTLRRALPELRWDGRAARLADRFWPGPLTLVLPDRRGGGLAVRVEGHAGLRAVLAAWGLPMTSTSLNRTGRPAAVSAQSARRILTDMPEVEATVLLLASGRLPGPPPSTMISLLATEATVLRIGAIPEARIRECLEEETSG